MALSSSLVRTQGFQPCNTGSNPVKVTKKIVMRLKIIYEDTNLIVIDKPPGIIVFSEEKTNPPASAMPKALRAGEKTIIDLILKKYPELKNISKTLRYGLIHRLDKDTSGILLIARNNQSLIFFQKQFQLKKVIKKYTALIVGNIKRKKGIIETIIERSAKNRKKQKVYLFCDPAQKKENPRKAITEYKTLMRIKNYTLVEIKPKTGRKHQIRCHLAYLGHLIAGDKIYGFKNQPHPGGLKRQFLHASYLEIILPNGEKKIFRSKLPKELEETLLKLNSK